jgi:hypothetical protein
MDQINCIRNLNGENLSLKLNLSLIEKLGVLDDQIKFIEFKSFSKIFLAVIFFNLRIKIKEVLRFRIDIEIQ